MSNKFDLLLGNPVLIERVSKETKDDVLSQDQWTEAEMLRARYLRSLEQDAARQSFESSAMAIAYRQQAAAQQAQYRTRQYHTRQDQLNAIQNRYDQMYGMQTLRPEWYGNV